MENYIEFLKEKVFQVERWPHYQLLIDDLIRLSSGVSLDDKILGMERTILYGDSVFAPLFIPATYVTMELSPATAYERPHYNKHLTEDPRFERYGLTFSWVPEFEYDLVIIPNAIHHVPARHQQTIFSIAYKALREGGTIYVYEQLIEDYHQMPDDYVRYTPSGMTDILRHAGFVIQSMKPTGGIFASAYYCLDTSLEYILDAGERENIKEMMSYIKNLDERYPENIERDHTSCPKAFSVTARKSFPSSRADPGQKA